MVERQPDLPLRLNIAGPKDKRQDSLNNEPDHCWTAQSNAEHSSVMVGTPAQKLRDLVLESRPGDRLCQL